MSILISVGFVALALWALFDGLFRLARVRRWSRRKAFWIAAPLLSVTPTLGVFASTDLPLHSGVRLGLLFSLGLLVWYIVWERSLWRLQGGGTAPVPGETSQAILPPSPPANSS